MEKIIINMTCGLANRMFQYCYYLYLLSKGYDAQIDYYSAAKLAHEKVSWDMIFPKATFKQASRMEVMLLGGGSSTQAKVRRRFLSKTCRTIQMPTSFDVTLPETEFKKAYVFGVFQNAEMVEENKVQILEKLEFAPIQGEQNMELVSRITSEDNSVAIHIRKGKDYAALDWYNNTCPASYYHEAISRIRDLIGKEPSIYVFTDNPHWVKDNLSDISYTLVDWNPTSGWGSHFDMQLMSLCKHNIISNSTYSWWGAYLNRNPEKIVIAPKYWFNPNGKYPEYLSDRVVCKNWITL